MKKKDAREGPGLASRHLSGKLSRFTVTTSPWCLMGSMWAVAKNGHRLLGIDRWNKCLIVLHFVYDLL